MPAPPPPPTLPPLPPRPKRSLPVRFLLFIVLPTFGAAVVLVVFFFFIALPILALSYNPLNTLELAPSGWYTPSSKAPPPDSAFFGEWHIADRSRSIPFANGAPHTFTSADTLVLTPDHKYRFTHRGIYDRNSKLICLRSEIGSWTVGQNFFGSLTLSLFPNFDSLHIDQTVLPDFTEEVPASKVEQMTEEQQNHLTQDKDNASHCSASNQRDSDSINDWSVATASGGRLAIYHDAPGMTDVSTFMPWHMVHVSIILYEHDS